MLKRKLKKKEVDREYLTFIILTWGGIAFFLYFTWHALYTGYRAWRADHPLMTNGLFFSTAIAIILIVAIILAIILQCLRRLKIRS